MQYIITYIQKDIWTAGKKTERGYEAYMDTYDSKTVYKNKAKIYEDINTAYHALNNMGLNRVSVGWQYVVDEFEKVECPVCGLLECENCEYCDSCTCDGTCNLCTICEKDLDECAECPDCGDCSCNGECCCELCGELGCDGSCEEGSEEESEEEFEKEFIEN